MLLIILMLIVIIGLIASGVYFTNINFDIEMKAFYREKKTRGCALWCCFRVSKFA